MMALVGYGSNSNSLRLGRVWIGWFSILIASIFIRDYYLQYTNFLGVSDKESVIVSPVILPILPCSVVR